MEQIFWNTLYIRKNNTVYMHMLIIIFLYYSLIHMNETIRSLTFVDVLRRIR